VSSATAYPLSWPLGYPRADERKPGQFSTSFAQARDGLLEELRLMRADAVVLSSNIELKPNGLPYAGRNPADPGLAVYFYWRAQQYVVACDCWLKAEHNLQAIRKTVEALRGIARWGTSEMMAAAFTGFKALPEQAGPGWNSIWWEVLGLPGPSATEADIQEAYKRAARTAHPDAGGSHEQMTLLNLARGQGLKSLTS
jgi:hypothetical protein